jgi:hypothetical protein
MTGKTQIEAFIETLGDMLEADRLRRRTGLAHQSRDNARQFADAFPRAAARTGPGDQARSVTETPP